MSFHTFVTQATEIVHEVRGFQRKEANKKSEIKIKGDINGLFAKNETTTATKLGHQKNLETYF